VIAIESRVLQVKNRIRAACERVHREPSSVDIVAVTKTQPIELIRKACALNFVIIGENRIQESIDKYGDGWVWREFPNVRLNLIGHLQSNKVRKAVQIFDSIDSVDSVELAQNIDRISHEAGKKMRVLLEVNTSGEPQKYGFEPDEALEAAININKLDHIHLAGLMTVGPNVEDPDRIRESFVELRTLFESIRGRIESDCWSVLSMGMSNDFEIAIEEGATEVRLGSILWGPRRLA
jgi:pyridoxal phosphate enzyme (YggS family)